MQRALVIGRHAGDLPGVEIVDTRPVQFPATAYECFSYLAPIMDECYQNDWSLIFQAVPGQLAVALAWIREAVVLGEPDVPEIPIGIVISKPAPRPAGVQIDIPVNDGNMFSNEREVVAAIKALNPNAKIDDSRAGWITVVVDPPMKFEFSHIEWL